MVYFNNSSRLGNQMFKYAAKIIVAKNNLCFFGSRKKLKYFRLTKADNFSDTFKINFFIRTLIKILIKLKISGAKKIVFDWYNDHNKQISNINFPAIIYISYLYEKYLTIHRNEIIKCFEIKSKYKKKYHEIRNQHFAGYSQIVAVHIRLGDYAAFEVKDAGGKDMTLPENYYKKLIDLNNKPSTLFVFLSDEINKVKEKYSYLKNAYFSDNDEITDMQFLMNADVCILSNSSFSWWGAWLNQKVKKIYVPQYFIGFKVSKEIPEGIIPENWIQVNAYDNSLPN